MGQFLAAGLDKVSRLILSLALLAFVWTASCPGAALAQDASLPAPIGTAIAAQAAQTGPTAPVTGPVTAPVTAPVTSPVSGPIATPIAAAPTVAPSQAPTAAPGSPAAASGSTDFRPRDYVLGVGDRLRLIVFQEPTLSGEFVIDSTGLAALPLIGEVSAAGLTVRQFEAAVEVELRRGYLNDPRVSAEVLNFRPFYILGEVARPGEYAYASNLTVLNAIATAGGFGGLANRSRVYIKHAGDEVETEVPLSGTLIVIPGDTIRVAKGSFYILGEIARPGEYAHSDGLTVINAVATAGGFSPRANRRRVFIQREGEAEETSERLEPGLRVRPGDTLRIGERFF